MRENQQILISPDNGIGLTQVTVSNPNDSFETKTLGSIVPGVQGDNPFMIETSPVAVDINLLKTDWRYNLEIGCRILLTKKVASVSEGDDATLLENWWYTLAYYNGFAVGGANDPANPIYSRVVSENWHWLSISRFPYQECVFNIVAQLYTLPIDLAPYFEPRAKVTLPGPVAVNIGAGHYDYVDASFTGHKSIIYYKDNRAVVDGRIFDDITVHWVEFGGPTGTPTVPFFSQRDERWRYLEMGPGGCKVGDEGCAMTDVAMLLKYYGSDADPGKLNTWLCNNGGYNNNCEIIWGTAANYDGPGGMTYIGGNDIEDNWSELDNQLSQGYPVIVKVDFNPDTEPVTQHWVLVTHRSGGSGNPSSYYINDPWDLSYTEKTLASYYRTFYGDTFFAMRIYHGVQIPSDIVLPPPDFINTTEVYQARNSITAGRVLIVSPGDVTFRAGNKIILKPGFTAKSGSKFHARIGLESRPKPQE